METLVSLLVVLVVGSVLIWAAKMLLTAFKVPPPIDSVIYVFVVLFVVIWAVSVVVGGGPLVPRWVR